MRPGRAVRLNNEMSGGVAVALNPPAMVPENVDVSVTPLIGDVGSVLPNVVSPMVAEGAPLADRVDKLLIDSVGCLPWLRPGGEGGLSSVAKDYHRSRDLTCTRGRAGSGAPWFLAG